MDLQTIIIGVLALAVFIVPVYLIQRKQKKQSNMVLDRMLSFCEERQMQLTKLDFWNEVFAIGIDEAVGKVVYFNMQDVVARQVIVDLADVKCCELVKDSRKVNGDLIIDQIVLRFHFTGPKRQSQELEFYNREQNMMLSNELHFANKWMGIVNSALATLPQIAKV
ncbi:hypothetical protein H9Q13_04735 [Pontibacter sp. JH31]|uniref:Uncharacterized protein n=1 Tax=Pontibacter aquaedesilientis TaxID=2766980 RepID=A0ABR7XGD2_9BACT|nr:hypothetical protein [Pontibacter aquaedesilientis]MBD1396461.1 hypothetical protein [Pontibacter aquaedesilientis]